MHTGSIFINFPFLICLLLWHQSLKSFLLKLGETPHGWRVQRERLYRSKVLLLASWCCSGGPQQDVRGSGRCRCWWRWLEAVQGWVPTEPLSPPEAPTLMPAPSPTTMAGVLGWRRSAQGDSSLMHQGCRAAGDVGHGGSFSLPSGQRIRIQLKRSFLDCMYEWHPLYYTVNTSHL